MRSRNMRWLAALLAALLVLSACGGGGKGKASSDASSTKSTKSSTSKSSDKSDHSEVSDVSDFSENNPVPGKTTFGPDDDDKIIKAAIDDVQAFWKDELPTVYDQQYDPISGGEFPYGPKDPPPACDGSGNVGAYEDNAQNAFYCPLGDFVAWDTVNLTNDLLDQFGPFTLGIVVAHELGHGVQQRVGVFDKPLPTFVTEQQADCFAGAWTQWVAAGKSDLFELKLADLDSALGGFLQIRDPVGTDSVNDESAHGSAFQRISAFEDGLTEGAGRCKSYPDGNINFVPEVFEPGSIDEAQGGNLPYNEIVPLISGNLDAFWQRIFTDINGSWTATDLKAYDPDTDTVRCGSDTAKGEDAIGLAFYCPDDDTAWFDNTYLGPYVNDNVGDLGVAVIIANLYSTRAQYLAQEETQGLDAALQQDCFTGVWVGTMASDELNPSLPENIQVTLSPGDLDEAVATFLKSSNEGENGTETGTGSAFQRLDAFRAGFFESFNSGYKSGISKCVGGAGASAASDDSASDVFSS